MQEDGEEQDIVLSWGHIPRLGDVNQNKQRSPVTTGRGQTFSGYAKNGSLMRRIETWVAESWLPAILFFRPLERKVGLKQPLHG